MCVRICSPRRGGRLLDLRSSKSEAWCPTGVVLPSLITHPCPVSVLQCQNIRFRKIQIYLCHQLPDFICREALQLVDIMINGKRLCAIADLPLDLSLK